MFGITECGDAGLDFTWIKELKKVDGAVIISKNLNKRLVNSLIPNRDKVIFHMTCTGYAGTTLEPNVPTPEFNHSNMVELINQGFPVEQIVLRVDPIIPTPKGIARAESVLKLFEKTGIKRVRYSFLDLYPHVVTRFKQAGLPLPYQSFNAPRHMMNSALDMLRRYESIYELESCAEATPHKCGCISQKDYDIIGVNKEAGKPTFKQRSTCLCPDKMQLIPFGSRCAHKCLYCFWK